MLESLQFLDQSSSSNTVSGRISLLRLPNPLPLLLLLLLPRLLPSLLLYLYSTSTASEELASLEHLQRRLPSLSPLWCRFSVFGTSFFRDSCRGRCVCVCVCMSVCVVFVVFVVVSILA